MTSDASDSAHPQGNGSKKQPVEAADQVLLVYDWECPVCDAYCRLVRLAPPAGRLCRVNARDPTQVMKEITAAGLDIDQGMVLKEGGQLYYGSDAINRLALLSSRSDLFNRLSYYVFRSRAVAHILYPGLRTFRGLLLKAMGKTKINNLGIEGNDRF